MDDSGSHSPLNSSAAVRWTSYRLSATHLSHKGMLMCTELGTPGIDSSSTSYQCSRHEEPQRIGCPSLSHIVLRAGLATHVNEVGADDPRLFTKGQA
eukprot:6210499-Pleurochrysis_carterae.AAC.2